MLNCTECICVGELAKAMAIVQGKLKPAVKSSENPFLKSKYADLAAVMDSCRALLSENEIAVFQPTTYKEDDNGCGVVVNTILIHSSGQYIQGELYMPVAKRDPQAMGSAITYARRYGLAAMVGIVADDDDGEAATERNEKKQTITQAQRQLLFERAKLAYGEAMEAKFKSKLAEYGYIQTSQVTVTDYDKISIELDEIIKTNKQ